MDKPITGLEATLIHLIVGTNLVLNIKWAIAAGVVGAISLILTAVNIIPNDTPIVTLENGQVQGRLGYSRDGKAYLEYLALPYAEPPINELRFEPPVSLKQRWSEVKQAVRYPPQCFQFDTLTIGKVVGVEDCLFLNVFTYETTPEKKKPVLVYIHGGGFVAGTSSMFGPSYLMDEDIVLVTVNYRLGPLGFLNSGDDVVRGNMGLKDQNLALKWVKKNIEKFGGDSNQITLFGESAGGASAHYHVISPLSQGLFQKAILQSGAVTAPWAFERDPRKVTINYAEQLGCPTENMKELIQCMKKIDPYKLMEPQAHTMIPTNAFLSFVPSLEKSALRDTFLSQEPAVILKSGNFSNIPLMMGLTSGEGGLRTAKLETMSEYIEEIDKSWSKYGPNALVYKDLVGKKEILKEIRQVYFGNATFTEDLHDFKKKFTSVNSDSMFFEPIHTAAKIHAKQGSPTFLYYYDYESFSQPTIYSICRAVRPDDWLAGELKMLMAIVVDLVKKNFIGGDGYPEYGVTHGNDLFQLWNAEGVAGFFMSDRDKRFSKKFVRSIVDFARNTDPLAFDGVKWPAIQVDSKESSSKTTSHIKYMRMAEDPKVIDEPFADRMPFWESVRRKMPNW